jgi:hypothetical protein
MMIGRKELVAMSKDKRVIPNYQHWIRGGKIDPKKHIEMTQEELKHVALCKGIKDTHPCKNPLYVRRKHSTNAPNRVSKTISACTAVRLPPESPLCRKNSMKS